MRSSNQILLAGDGTIPFTTKVTYTADSTLVIPLTCSIVRIKGWGAGGIPGVSNGGGGGFAQTDVSVTPGETLYIKVNSSGGLVGVFRTSGTPAIANALLIAGSGGGGSNGSGAGGPGGGTSGIAGTNGEATAGSGGSAVSGGAGGGSSYNGYPGGTDAGNGSALTGGFLGTDDDSINSGMVGYGGDGGAGYYGGGGGGGYVDPYTMFGGAGGGGGSSYTKGTNNVNRAGSGSTVANAGDGDYVAGKGSGVMGSAGLVVIYY